MKEYKKMYDVNEFKKRIIKDIDAIKTLDNNYIIQLEEAEEENYICCHINYNSNIGLTYSQLKYNTIDVISEYIRAVKETLLNIEEIERK